MWFINLVVLFEWVNVIIVEMFFKWFVVYIVDIVVVLLMCVNVFFIWWWEMLMFGIVFVFKYILVIDFIVLIG